MDSLNFPIQKRQAVRIKTPAAISREDVFGSSACLRFQRSVRSHLIKKRKTTDDLPSFFCQDGGAF